MRHTHGFCLFVCVAWRDVRLVLSGGASGIVGYLQSLTTSGLNEIVYYNIILVDYFLISQLSFWAI